jgi:hypothetical protein
VLDPDEGYKGIDVVKALVDFVCLATATGNGKTMEISTVGRDCAQKCGCVYRFRYPGASSIPWTLKRSICLVLSRVHFRLWARRTKIMDEQQWIIPCVQSCPYVEDDLAGATRHHCSTGDGISGPPASLHSSTMIQVSKGSMRRPYNGCNVTHA